MKRCFAPDEWTSAEKFCAFVEPGFCWLDLQMLHRFSHSYASGFTPSTQLWLWLFPEGRAGASKCGVNTTMSLSVIAQLSGSLPLPAPVSFQNKPCWIGSDPDFIISSRTIRWAGVRLAWTRLSRCHPERWMGGDAPPQSSAGRQEAKNTRQKQKKNNPDKRGEERTWYWDRKKQKTEYFCLIVWVWPGDTGHLSHVGALSSYNWKQK